MPSWQAASEISGLISPPPPPLPPGSLLDSNPIPKPPPESAALSSESSVPRHLGAEQESNSLKKPTGIIGEANTRNAEQMKDELIENIIRGESYQSLVNKLSHDFSNDVAQEMVSSAFAELEEIKKSGRLPELEYEIFFNPKKSKKHLLRDDEKSGPEGLGGWLIIVVSTFLLFLL